jgi:hypothetical protein
MVRERCPPQIMPFRSKRGKKGKKVSELGGWGRGGGRGNKGERDCWSPDGARESLKH